MTKKILCGLSIVVFGLLVLLGNFDIIDFSFTFSRLWPILLIMFVLGDIVDNKKFEAGSFILLLIGGFFLLKNFNIINISFYRLIFPLFLIILGIVIMLPKKENKEESDVEIKKLKNDLMINAIFSSRAEKSNSSLKKVEITSVFGAVTLDLNDAEAKNGKCVCDASVFFGGVDIILPEDWEINVDGVTRIFGGVEDKRDNIKKTKNILYLKGLVVFGGIDIK